MFGIFFGYFQLGCFYGPTFATVQELVPPQIRGTVVAFYILSLNFFGLGLGVTGGGIVVDWMIAEGIAEPYTMTLLAVAALSLIRLLLFLLIDVSSVTVKLFTPPWRDAVCKLILL